MPRFWEIYQGPRGRLPNKLGFKFSAYIKHNVEILNSTFLLSHVENVLMLYLAHLETSIYSCQPSKFYRTQSQPSIHRCILSESNVLHNIWKCLLCFILGTSLYYPKGPTWRFRSTSPDFLTKNTPTPTHSCGTFPCQISRCQITWVG